MSENGKNYELLYIVPNQFTEDEVKAIKEKIDALLKTHGAVLGFEEILGKKKLAYPIDKSAHGTYVVTEFELTESSQLKEINDYLRLSKEILRAQIIAKRKITEKEIAQQKRQRSEELEEPREFKPRTRERERQREEEEKPAPKKATTEKKIELKELDEKLEEILKTDDLL